MLTLHWPYILLITLPAIIAIFIITYYKKPEQPGSDGEVI